MRKRRRTIATGIDGAANACSTLTAGGANGTILQSRTIASAAKTLSAFVRRKTGTGDVFITLDNDTTRTDITSLINSTTYTRVSMTQTLANPVFGFKIAESGDEIEVDMVMLENSASFASSPIPTTTAAVARNADVLTYPTTGWLNESEGTIFIQLVTGPGIYNGSTEQFVQIDDGTSDERQILNRTTTATFFGMVDGGVAQGNIDTGATDNNTTLKFVGTYAPNDMAVCKDGGTVGTDTSATLPSGQTIVRIGHAISGLNPFSGPIRRVAYFGSRLTNAELQTLTGSADYYPPPNFDTTYEVERPRFTFTEDNIVGGWAFHKGGKSERLNRVRARFFNPAKGWQPDFSQYDDAADRALDGGILLEREIVLPFTSNFYRAQQLARLEQQLSRDDITAEFTATIEGLRCEVGDVVKITHSTPGWSAKSFRVTRMDLMSSDEVRVTVKEYQAASYDLSGLDTEPVEGDTNLPDPFTVSAPTGLTVTQSNSVVDTANASWTNADSFAVLFQVEYRLASVIGSPDEPWTILPQTRETSIAVPRLDPRIYEFRVKAINTIGVSSGYSSTAQVVMEGKLIRPYGSFSGLGYISKVAEILVGEGSEHLAWAPRQNLIFIGCNVVNTVDVLNPVTDAVIATIALNGAPDGVTYSPPNDRIYVGAVQAGSPANDRVLYVINPTSLLVEDTITLPSSQGSGEGAFCPSNGKLYFCGLDVAVLDPIGSPIDVQTIAIAGAGAVTHICYCPSNDRLYVSQPVGANIRVINPDTDSVVATISVDTGVSGLCYCPENDRIYSVSTQGHINVINPSTNAIESTITGGSPNLFETPADVTFSLDSRLVYVAEYGAAGIGHVTAIRPSDNVVLSRIEIDAGALRILWVPSTSKIYIAHEAIGGGQLTAVGV